jgi:ADP-ribose pyrophosphatase YjhB (NUDIX family)
MPLPAPTPPHWLPEEEWRKIQRCLPILCVEVLPVRRAGGAVSEIGLILRDTPHEGVRWCLLGGRLRYGEPLAGAVGREIREALGGVGFAWDGDGEPLAVAQYLPTPQAGGLHDPRQHAVSLVHAVALSGPPSPQGEARDFRWFAPARLPEAIGFGQQALLDTCLSRL